MQVTDRDIRLKNTSVVKTFPLNWQPAREGKIFVGSNVTKSYIIIDSYWLPIIDLLLQGLNLDEIVHNLSEIDPHNFHNENASSKVKIMIIELAQNKLIEKIITK